MPPSPQVIDAPPAEISHHTARPLSRRESARVWRHGALPGVELFHGLFRKHDFAPHYHAAATIGIVERGVMRSWCRSAHHVAPAGSIILYNPEEVHAPGPGNDEAWSFRTFYLDHSILQGACTVQAGDRPFFKQPFVQDQDLAMGLLRLHRLLEQSATSLQLESSLLDLLIQLLQRYGGVAAETATSGNELQKIGRVREFIHEHYWQEVTLARLAEIAGFSQYHLLRTFRKMVGLTPHAYLIQARVEAAKELLRAGIAPAVVAVSTGFVDQSHFNRQFKRIVGTTPGQYHPELRSRRRG